MQILSYLNWLKMPSCTLVNTFESFVVIIKSFNHKGSQRLTRRTQRIMLQQTIVYKTIHLLEKRMGILLLPNFLQPLFI